MIQATSPLRLFTGHQDDCSVPEFWTVRQAFEAMKLPEMKHKARSERTIAKWEKAIWYWEQVTDNPPICRVTSDLLTDFPSRLLDPKRAFDVNTNTTANANLMYIRGILRACEEHLPRVPRAWPLPQQAATRHRRVVPPEVLAEMHKACDVARYDRHRCRSYCRSIPAPVLMRATLALFLSIGCRRTEGLTMDASAYRRQPEFPDFPEHPQLEVDAESPHGWLVFHTPKTRARKDGLPLVLPVSEVLAKHLNELDRLAPRRHRMLPLGDAPTTWANQLKRVQKAAGIENFYTWQDLRKTANRMFRKAGGREVAKFMLGHQPRGVNATWYDDLAEDAVIAVERVQLPQCFQEVG